MGKKRKGLSKRQRFEVFKRDGFTCQYCGGKPPTVILEADHIIPVSDGGPDHESNMVTSCFECNRGKSNIPLDQVPASLTDQIHEKRERAAQVKAFNDFLMDLRQAEDDAINRLGMRWYNHFKRDKNRFVFGASRVTSIRTFLKRLPEAEILDSIDIAHAKYQVFGSDDERTFRYFCGICWRKIKEGQQ